MEMLITSEWAEASDSQTTGVRNPATYGSLNERIQSPNILNLKFDSKP